MLKLAFCHRLNIDKAPILAAGEQALRYLFGFTAA